MFKTACVVLAAGLILPLPTSWAEAPVSGDPAVRQQTATAILLAPQSAPRDLAGRAVLAAGARENHLVAVTPDGVRRSAQLAEPSPRLRSQPCLAAGGEGPDLCGFGVAISEAKPCLAAGDCPAYETWERVMGTPGVEPAPESKVRAARWAQGEPGPPE